MKNLTLVLGEELQCELGTRAHYSLTSSFLVGYRLNKQRIWFLELVVFVIRHRL